MVAVLGVGGGLVLPDLDVACRAYQSVVRRLRIVGAAETSGLSDRLISRLCPRELLSLNDVDAGETAAGIAAAVSGRRALERHHSYDSLGLFGWHWICRSDVPP